MDLDTDTAGFFGHLKYKLQAKYSFLLNGLSTTVIKMISARLRSRITNHSAWVATYAASQYLQLSKQALATLGQSAPALLADATAIATCLPLDVYLTYSAAAAGTTGLNEYLTNSEALTPVVADGATALLAVAAAYAALHILDGVLRHNRPVLAKSFAALCQHARQCQDNIGAYRGAKQQLRTAHQPKPL